MTQPAYPVPPANNIDPYASRPQNAYGTVGEPAPSGLVTNPGPVAGPAPAAPAAPATPALGGPTGPGGNYTVDQLTAQNRTAVDQANAAVADIWTQIKPLQQQYQQLSDIDIQGGKGQQITSQLNGLYTNLASAQQKVETANTALSTSLQSAIKTTTMDPAQTDLYTKQAAQADAQAGLAHTQADVLQQGSQGQRDLVAAQVGQTVDDGNLKNAQAQLAAAQADNTGRTTPAQIQALQGQAAQAQATANSTNAMIQPLVDKTTAETGLTVAQTGLTGSQSDLAKAQAGQASANANLAQAQANLTTARIPGETGLLAGQTQLAGAQAGLAGAQAGLLTPAQAAAQNATAAGTLADIQKGLQGPLYGLSDQINAIRAIQQQVFGPGGSGNPQDASDLLGQYTTAAISGTTPYAANVAAANAGLTQFGTQASMYNAAQQALASRANALAGLGGNVLSTLGTMNANAPAGSTAMAGAFRDVMNYAAQQQQQVQQAMGGAPQQPTAPALPALLQRLTGAGAGPTATAGVPGAGGMPAMAQQTVAGAPNAAAQTLPYVYPTGQPPPAAAQTLPYVYPTGQPPPGPLANAQALTATTGAPQTGTNAPVTINIGGQGQAQGAPTPPAGGFAPPSQQPGTYGQLSGGMPSMLQNYAPPTPDFVHQLWGNELQSGAVQSPYAAMAQPTPYVGG